jgi:hypothetical protein
MTRRLIRLRAGGGAEHTGLRARPLDESTWSGFAQLVERHNGVWGGCWCMGFHAEGVAAALGALWTRSPGAVESSPEDADGRSVSGSFLHNGRVSMFESHGFERTRRIGKHHWVVTKVVDPGVVA